VYFDNATTTQKPRYVIQRVNDVYTQGIANVHRAVNFLADEVTRAFEESRQQVAQFLGMEAREIIFVRNATQTINVVWRALSRKKSLRVLTTTLEHHSNLLPWTAEGQGEFVPWSSRGQNRWPFVSHHALNETGFNDVCCCFKFSWQYSTRSRKLSKSVDLPGLIDASQSIRHERINVRQLAGDYLVFSGHKIYGPSGVGVLYIKREILDSMDPVFLGGSMV